MLPSVDALVASARQLLTQKSPSAIGGREISDHAQVNYGLIHRHFRTKDRLLFAAYREMTRDFIARALPGHPDDIDFVQLGPDDEFWPAAIRIALDPGTAAAHDVDVSLVESVRALIEGRRPDLDADHLDCLTAIGICLVLGLPVNRSVHAPLVGLDPHAAAIDEWTAAWGLDIVEARGPFGAPAPRPRSLAPPPATTVPSTVLPGGPGRSSAERQLIRSAASLMSARAPSEISGRDVANAAGLPYGLVHYHFGSVDRLLAEAVDYLRDRFFVNESRNGEPPEFFAISRHRGYLMVAIRMGLDDHHHDQHGLSALAGSVVAVAVDDDAPPALRDRARVGAMTSLSVQGMWTLLTPWLSAGLGRPVGDLEPLAAAYLARLVRWAADPGVTVDRTIAPAGHGPARGARRGADRE